MNLQTAARKTSPARTGADSGQRLVLQDIDWTAYKKICAAIGNRRKVFMTYDRGTLEIMTTSFKHDRYSNVFPLLIFTLARFYNQKIAACGSFTLQRKDIKRGFEPDQCFYLANVPAIQGKTEIDLTRDPPPDLLIEVDISRSSLDRMSVFAAFGISEVWRFDKKTIRIYPLQGAEYEEVERSPAFPEVPVDKLVSFLEIGVREDLIKMVEQLESWLVSLPSAGKPGKKSKKP